MPETAPITEISEALKLLNVVVERGENIVKGVSPGPWSVGYWKSPRGARECSGVGNQDGLLQICSANAESRDVTLIAASRSLVPAMVKGAQAVLDTHEKINLSPHEKDKGYWLECSEWYLVSIANAYRPALEELGWWPK